MRTMFVFNPKGGSGKTTVSTNLAAHYALTGARVGILDLDPQGSSMHWLERRPPQRPAIAGAAGVDGYNQLQGRIDVLVIDSPPGLKGVPLGFLMRVCQTVVVPVVPAPFDVDAMKRFVHDVAEVRAKMFRPLKIATLVNRTRGNAPERRDTEARLNGIALPDGTRMPCVTWLRNSKNYVTAASRGLGVCELTPSRASADTDLFRPLIDWVNEATGAPEGARAARVRAR